MAKKNNMQLIYLIGSVLLVAGLVYYLGGGQKRQHRAQQEAHQRELAEKRELEVDIHLPGHTSEEIGAKVEHFSNCDKEELPRPVDTSLSCETKDQIKPEELLPLDKDTEWSKANPVQSDALKDKNFLLAGHNIGINTVGQTLRNANLQLRSEPPNPQTVVSPFLQSTIEPDIMRLPLEIGGACQ